MKRHPDPAGDCTCEHCRALNVLSWTDVSRGTVNGAEGGISSSFMVWSLGDDVERPGINEKGDGRQQWRLI